MNILTDHSATAAPGASDESARIPGAGTHAARVGLAHAKTARATSRLHRRVKFPYYVVAPDYRETSSGIQCVHYLCHALNLEGADAYVVGCTEVHPGLKTPRLTDEVRNRHATEGRPYIAIYPETVSGNPLAAALSVRYMLNREGVIGGNVLDAGPDDIFVYHRAEFVDPARPGEVMTLPMVDPETFSPEPVEERTLALLYLNRVPKSAVDFAALPADVQVISPDTPLPLEELAPLFRRARVLYTFESSTTCRLAAMCGCPVVSLEAPGHERYACTPQTRVDIGGGIVWDDSPASLAQAMTETAAVRQQHLQAEKAFWQQLQVLLRVSQDAVRERAPLRKTAAARPLMQQWLAERRPNPAQAAIIEQTLQAATCPTLGIVVVGGTCPPEGAAATIESLCRAHALYPHIRVHWFGTPPTNEAQDAGALELRFHPNQDPGGQVAAINRIVQEGECEWVLAVAAGSEFIASGLLAAALELVAAPQMRALCADEMMRDGNGELSALLRPDFNLDLLLSMPSGLSRHWLFRRDVFLDAGGFDPASADAPEFDLLLRLIDAGGIDGFGHVHEPLLVLPPQEVRTRQAELDALDRHLRNRGYEHATVAAHLPGCYRISYGHQATPGVSIVIPSRNQFALLNRCVESLLEKTAYTNYEVLIVDNGSTDSDACNWLDGIEAMESPQLRVLRHPQPFDYAAMVNLAARHARGEYLLLLDNDTAILREDWLDAMLNHAQRPEVGVVGAKLLNADGTVQHAGMVLGLQGPATTAGERLEAPGYMYRLQVDQNYSAVSGSCLMVRKSVFDKVGGMDGGALRNTYSDADLCLKVRQAGYLVVWTPHALMLHEGGASQAREDRSSVEAKAQARIEAQDAMYAKWLPVLARDPAYNRNLVLTGPAFQVETDSAFNRDPLPWRPLPVALALPADRYGCGHYRVIQPARVMGDFGLADTRLGDRYWTPVEMERLSPDVVVLQRQMLRGQLEPQQRMTRFSRCFKVAELDDYLPNVPMKSAHKGQLPSDVLKSMREALKLVDRFVVSTAPLAEALRGLHPDTRVVENRLPLPWWQDVTARRRQGRRPRVGWGGGAGHRGDLELIADVVRALADEVEWVFFGMCPDRLRPYVHEFHPGVAIEDYPARLAGLDLDLALAPLEDNLFNQCKSNLRLLEYGACGFPVVCSDVEPYRCDLPVTRVKPRFRDWVEAIRMHTHDLGAAARAGDALRAAVHRDWMLDERHASFWLSQWLPD